MNCEICGQGIRVGDKVVRLAGGLLDPEDPQFFVEDQDILREAHVHRACLINCLTKGNSSNLSKPR